MADKIVVMNNAEIVQIGTPQEVYERPNSPFVADFIGAINFMEDDSKRDLHLQDQQSLAIRPEHIHLGAFADDQGGDLQYGKIQNIEFRGSFYRVTLQWMDDQRLADPRFVMIDISTEQSKGLQLTKEQVIPFSLPKERIITFQPEKPLLVHV